MCANLVDIKYIQFGGEIKSLRDSVKQLYDVISNAENQRPRPWHRRDADQHINNPNMKALSQVTGDFLQTLQECERLLKDNSKFERGAAGFVNNVIWHSSTERKVNTLKQRVHFHQTKISFIAKPFETQLLLGIQQELKEIRRDVAVLKGILINDTAWASGRESLLSSEESSPIPQDLALRFKQGLSINSPGAFRVGDDLPLQEGFDALIFHFASSTVNFNANLGLGQNIPEEPQYLNLLKSKWILDRLRESANFQSVEQESLWGEYMRELEGEIRYEYSRFQNRDLFAPSFEVLSRLPDSCFNIWVDEGSLRYPAALTEEQPFEEKILELDLNSPHPSRQSTLTIFRKSDITFRLVTTTKDEQNADLHREESEDVNMGEIRLIPTFATSEGGSNPNNNVLLYGNYSQPKCYTLCSSSDVSRFQHALMGFRVSHNMSDVKWCIEYHNYLKPGLSGKARLQLWQVKPLIKKSPQEFSPAGSRTTRSAHSPSESANLRRFWTSGTSQRPGTTLVSPVIGANGDGVALLYPEPPVLVLFTECEKRYSILHLQCKSSMIYVLTALFVLY